MFAIAKIRVTSPILSGPCFYAVDENGIDYLTSDEANAALVTEEDYRAIVAAERAEVSEWTWLGNTPAAKTKQEAIRSVMALYRTMNAADSDSSSREEWTIPAMAGEASCRHLDNLLRSWLEHGVLTGEEHQAIYDTL